MWRFVTMVMAAVVLAGCDNGQITEAKDQVRSELRDPDSAKFRSVTTKDNTTCGQVNGKNGYGGYTGYKRFMYTPGLGGVRYDPATDASSDISAETMRLQIQAFNAMWAAFCAA